MTFRAKVVDAVTGEPVAGVRLWHWQHPGIEGRSDKNGIVTIPDMMPGKFNFQVECTRLRPLVVGAGSQRVEPPQDRRDAGRLAAQLRPHRFRPPKPGMEARDHHPRAWREDHGPGARPRRQAGRRGRPSRRP